MHALFILEFFHHEHSRWNQPYNQKENTILKFKIPHTDTFNSSLLVRGIEKMM